MSEKKPAHPVFDATQIVNEQLTPLVTQLHQLCLEHNIPMVLGIAMRSDESGEYSLEITQVAPNKYLPGALADASRCIRGVGVAVPKELITLIGTTLQLVRETQQPAPEGAILH